MSIDIMSRLWWRDDLPTMEKFVAIALADSANDEGFCWPAIATIAQKCSIAERTAQRAVKSLCAKMLLRQVNRPNRSSYYVFVMSNLPRCERKRRRKEVGPIEIDVTGDSDDNDLFGTGDFHDMTGDFHDMTGDTQSPRNVIEPSLEPSESMSDHDVVERWKSRWDQFASDVPGFGKMLTFNETRAKHLLARVDEFASDRTPDALDTLFNTIFERIAGSRFLRGLKTDWKVPGCDWVLNRTNFNKIMEGSYVQDFADGDECQPANPGRSINVAARQRAAELLDGRI